MNDYVWLEPPDQLEACVLMKELGLLKYSPEGDLFLKSGAKTDLYFNLRQFRGSVKATELLARTFAQPIRELGVQRFVEIPQALSSLCGLITVLTQVPHITIREEPKKGREYDEWFIGPFEKGEKVCIIDDVITTGESKIRPIWRCIEAGLDVVAVVVLVERSNEWRRIFRENNLDVLVWPGMRMEDVRGHLRSLTV